ncbi:hypothetical protein TNCV_1953971 [Trichonephila clavipes]|nr:hypothetical protein TNCV_1953971 [Trichonephila clavipes]
MHELYVELAPSGAPPCRASTLITRLCYLGRPQRLDSIVLPMSSSIDSIGLTWEHDILVPKALPMPTQWESKECDYLVLRCKSRRRVLRKRIGRYWFSGRSKRTKRCAISVFK